MGVGRQVKRETALISYNELKAQHSGDGVILLVDIGSTLDFRRSLVSGLLSPRREFGEERGLLSRTAAGNRVYLRSYDVNLSPPDATLLAARSIAARTLTCFAFFPSPLIFEEKRDCSQSIVVLNSCNGPERNQSWDVLPSILALVRLE